MRVRVLAAAAALSLCFVACDGASSKKGDLAGLRERGTLRVAMTGMYPPFNFFDEGGAVKGFDVDVANEIARRLQLRPEIVTLRWDGIIPGLLAERYDVIIGSMAVTPEREKAVDFSAPYYVSGAQAFAKKGSPRAAQGSLSGAVVGVTLGTTYEAAVRKHEGVAEVRTYAGIPEILADLEAGRIDAFVSDKLVGMHAAMKAGRDVVPVGPPLYEERVGVALKKEQPALRAALDDAVRGMKADGTASRFATTWFGRDVFAGQER